MRQREAEAAHAAIRGKGQVPGAAGSPQAIAKPSNASGRHSKISLRDSRRVPGVSKKRPIGSFLRTRRKLSVERLRREWEERQKRLSAPKSTNPTESQHGWYLTDCDHF